MKSRLGLPKHKANDRKPEHTLAVVGCRNSDSDESDEFFFAMQAFHNNEAHAVAHLDRYARESDGDGNVRVLAWAKSLSAANEARERLLADGWDLCGVVRANDAVTYCGIPGRVVRHMIAFLRAAAPDPLPPR